MENKPKKPTNKTTKNKCYVRVTKQRTLSRDKRVSGMVGTQQIAVLPKVK